jgi:hypothetical protein
MIVGIRTGTLKETTISAIGTYIVALVTPPTRKESQSEIAVRPSILSRYKTLGPICVIA